jgi:putative peptide zinc metalloprotease protein
MESLPKFRFDLTAFHQQEKDGKTRVVLKDNVSGKYFRLSEYEYTLLKALDGTVTLEQAVEKLRNAGHYYSEEDAKHVLGKAAQLGLLLGTRFGTSQFQQHLKGNMERARRTKFLSSVYFLFIPILNPDRFLEKTLWIFRLVANKWTAVPAALAAPGALYLVISGIPRMELGYLFFFNWQNLLLLWITLAITKLVHEFSHAYAAKRLGLHVPEMGVAFLIFFPCLYCNTTDAWQLADRKQRAVISAAGIIAEAIIAIVSAYIWYFSKPGMINSLAFYLMAVSFVSTVLFNGNPLLKFDGYFILIDFLGMPNLATNSFKYLKYLFNNKVLGNTLFENPAANTRETLIFTVYGISAFLYRIVLYAGIIGAVYYRFDKAIGILLALLALCLFVVRPTFLGVKSLYTGRREIHPKLSGLAVFAAIFAVTLGILCLPWSTKSVYPCFVDSQKTQKLAVPIHTLVKEVFVREGSSVQKGEVLFSLDISYLSLKLKQKHLEREVVENEIEMLLLDEDERSQAGKKEVELRQVEDEIKLLKDQFVLVDKSTVAPFDGVVTDLDARLQEGFQPGEGVVVGDLRSLTRCVVRALVPAKDIHKVRQGKEVEIWLPVGPGRVFRRKIDAIKSYSETDLRNSPFSSRVGGELATEVRDERQKDSPLEAQYDCSVNLVNDNRDILLGMTGRLAVSSPPRSVAARVYENIVRTFNRESLL